MGFGGFSLKRAVGISKLKSKIAKTTGIPTTRQGRRIKLRRLLSVNVGGRPKASAGGSRQPIDPQTPAPSMGFFTAVWLLLRFVALLLTIVTATLVGIGYLIS